MGKEFRGAEAANVTVPSDIPSTSAPAPGRGLYSSTSQLNLSRVCHKRTFYTP